MKLVYRLFTAHNYIFFQVLWMDNRQRGSSSLRNTFRASNGISVASSYQPDISRDSIHLPGESRRLDNSLRVETFRGNEVSRHVNALREWAKEDWTSDVFEEKDPRDSIDPDWYLSDLAYQEDTEGVEYNDITTTDVVLNIAHLRHVSFIQLRHLSPAGEDLLARDAFLNPDLLKSGTIVCLAGYKQDVQLLKNRLEGVNTAEVLSGDFGIEVLSYRQKFRDMFKVHCV